MSAMSELDARDLEQKLVRNQPLTHEESLALYELLQVVRTTVESDVVTESERSIAWGVAERSYRDRFAS